MELNEIVQIIHDLDKERLYILAKKSHDYANKDALANFKRMCQLCKILDIDVGRSPADCALFLLVLKLDRWCNLRSKDTKPSNESIKDTILDAHNYIDLAYACEKETN